MDWSDGGEQLQPAWDHIGQRKTLESWCFCILDTTTWIWIKRPSRWKRGFDFLAQCSRSILIIPPLLNLLPHRGCTKEVCGPTIFSLRATKRNDESCWAIINKRFIWHPNYTDVPGRNAPSSRAARWYRNQFPRYEWIRCSEYIVCGKNGIALWVDRGVNGLMQNILIVCLIEQIISI